MSKPKLRPFHYVRTEPDAYELFLEKLVKQKSESKQKPRIKLCTVCGKREGDSQLVDENKFLYPICGFCVDLDGFMWCEKCDLVSRGKGVIKCLNCKVVLLN